MRYTIISVFAFAMFLSGCVGFTHETIYRDPTWLRVAAINNSPYRIHMEGVFTGTIEPHSATYVNVGCRGAFQGVAHAYKEIGRSASGNIVEQAYMGESTFTLYVDGRNAIYNGEVLDNFVTFYEGSFYRQNNIFGEKTHYISYNPCSVLAPDITFTWGK